ncbi:IS1096 element passenger TnpR family protein, partial [Methanobrevibacter sp.]|uniref:IS1096 element passenger TnpR family protein n=1 Tax=Methanobrevibacter sp. TaxID=66852 RepID=UPI00388F5ED7
KFTYVYDFGDWWEHTIEVLNYIEDYEFDYPQVTKFKQSSPPDDCGGIYGYYEFLEQYLDESNPEQTSIAEWARGQGYHDDYDLDEINEEMEDILDFDSDDFD